MATHDDIPAQLLLPFLKRCSKCRSVLPFSEYSPHPRGKNGLQPHCRVCHRAYHHADPEKTKSKKKQYRQDNAERIKQSHHDYYLRNREKVLKKCQQWRKKNPDKYRIMMQRYYRENSEKLISRSRHRYQSKRDEILIQCRKYYQEHKEQYIAHCRLRKRRLREAPGECSLSQWIAKCEYFGWRCYLCGCHLTRKNLTMDHRTPITRGGSNWPANIAPCCRPCNLSKHTRTEAEYRASML